MFLIVFAVINRIIVNIHSCTCLDSSLEMPLGCITESKILGVRPQNCSQGIQFLGSHKVGGCGVMSQEFQFSFAIKLFPVRIQKASASISSTFSPPTHTHTQTHTPHHGS